MSKRATIYCRVSSTNQEDNYSLDTQEADARALCAREGIAVVDVVREIHTGADLDERPKFIQVRLAFAKGGFDTVT